MRTKPLAEKSDGTYSKLVQDLKTRSERLCPDNPYSKDRMAFLHVSAAIYHLYSSQITDQKAFFRHVYYHEQLALLDRRELTNIRNQIQFTGTHELLRETQDGGRILVSFHYGSFFASLAALSANDLDVTVGMSPAVYAKIKTDLLADTQRLIEHDNSKLKLELVDMGEPMAIFRLARRLRSGKDVFAFIDGDSRQRIMDNEQRRIRIPFLEGALLISSGFAYLSYLTGAPLVPMISYRAPRKGTVLDFMDWIYPDTAHTAETYAKRSMTKLFRYLETRVKADPTQWEGWLYIHQLVERKNNPEYLTPEKNRQVPSDEYLVNHQRYGLIAGKSDHYLFDRQQYRLLWIPSELFELLDNRTEQQTVIQADEQTMDYLFREHILIPQIP